MNKKKKKNTKKTFTVAQKQGFFSPYQARSIFNSQTFFGGTTKRQTIYLFIKCCSFTKCFIHYPPLPAHRPSVLLNPDVIVCMMIQLQNGPFTIC